MPERKEPLPGKPVSPLPCACANLRRAARIVTQFYDQELRPSGLRVTQFTLLQALAIGGSMSQGRLGNLLGLDSTTLTRTLRLLRKQGWIEAERAEDRRQLRLKLTPGGWREHRRAMPQWRSAQRRLRRALGESAWKNLLRATVGAAAATPGR